VSPVHLDECRHHRTLSHRQARYRGRTVNDQLTDRAAGLFHLQLNQEKHMNPLSNPPSNTEPVDEDLVEQANPGHGIPSQDPETAAQAPLEPHEAEREANSVLTGGGLVAGAATGAAIGVAVAGPVGILVGATLGAVAGALGGAAAGATASPEGLISVDAAPADTVRLHIEDSGGGGRPVVLIHGWPLSAQAWAPQVSVLQAAGFRVVAYDRRGFGRSDKPESDYGYDTLADDLQRVMDQCGLQDVTLLGFSMGGGEVARYIARHGESRLRSVVFAAAVPPYLMKTTDNPEGPLTPENAQQMKNALEQDRSTFFDQFTKDFFSANGVLQVTESQRSEAIALCGQSAQHAALACMDAFGTTDFREDLNKVTVPTLVIHGEADAIVPIEGSGQLTHRAVPHSELVRVSGAPHGLNVSHAQAFNDALLSFLRT
jgi:pimeloyl-ACP methyl ester carboxylesterase